MEPTSPSMQYGFAGYCLEPATRRLLAPDGSVVALNDRAFDTLACLLAHAGQTLGKDFLLAQVWPNEVVEENNLNQAILALRKALGDDSRNPRFIRTITRRGFCFVAQVEELPLPAPGETPSPALPQPLAPAGRPAWLLPAAAVVLLALGALLLWLASQPEPAAPPAAVALVAAEDVELLPDSVAILPFRSLGYEPLDELMSSGLHAEIISRLSNVRGLRVIGRESVLNPALDTSNLDSVRRTLRVESVMSGTVLQTEDRARINLELVDSSSQITLWTESYEIDTRNLNDIFVVQGDIALHVATTLASTLDRGDLEGINLQPTRSRDAYGYQLASRQAFETQDTARAWELGKLAVELDPDYLDAIYNFSHINAVLISQPLPLMDADRHLQLALELADRYIALAPDRPQGYTLRGTALNIAGNWRAVLAELERIADKGFRIEDLRFSSFLLSLGKFDMVIPSLERQLELNPLNPYTRGFLMIAHEAAGDPQRAREIHATGDELLGQWWGDEVQLVLSLGRHESPRDIDELLVSDSFKRMLHNLHDKPLVRSLLQARLADESSNRLEWIYLSALAASIGDEELATRFLHGAVANGWITLLWAWLPVFDELRASDGFRAIIEEFGVTEYWNHLGWPEACEPDRELMRCSWQAYTAL